MKVSDEVAGENCTNGGKKIETGIDENDNGELDAGEVDQTEYVCNGEDGQDVSENSICTNSYLGDVTVTDVNYAEFLKEFDCIDGTLEIDAEGETIAFPNLKKVSSLSITQSSVFQAADFSSLIYSGSISIDGNIKNIDFSSLKIAGEMVLDSSCPQHLNISFPLLESSNEITIRSALEEVSFAKLTDIGGDLNMENATTLTSFEAPLLKNVYGNILLGETVSEIEFESLENVYGGIYFEENSSVESASFPKLENMSDKIVVLNYIEHLSLPVLEVAELYIGKSSDSSETYSNHLNSLDISSLKGGVLSISQTNLTGINIEIFEGELTIEDNEILESVSVGPVMPESLTIKNNEALTSINLNSATPSTLKISNNDSLPDINFPDITKVNGDFIISGNDDLDSINLPLLTEVEGLLYIVENDLLPDISIPNIAKVNGEIKISGNDDLDSISFPLLTEINGHLQIVNNDLLSEVKIPSLNNIIGSFSEENFFGDDTMSIYYSNSLTVSENDNLTEFSCENLENVTGDITVEDNSKLASFSMDKLILIDSPSGYPSYCGYLEIRDNPLLTDFSFDLLEEVGSVSISYNDSLLQSFVDDFVTQIESAGNIRGNISTYENNG